MPQGFRDSPHLFGQSLSQDIQNFNNSEAVVLKYVDDILLCAETEEACSRASDFLNFLAGCGYKASREKAQLCQQLVRYLGLIISEGTRAIGPERIKPILNHPHRTGKGWFSFQFQRKAMPKNAQTTTQLHSSHMLVK